MSVVAFKIAPTVKGGVSKGDIVAELLSGALAPSVQTFRACIQLASAPRCNCCERFPVAAPGRLSGRQAADKSVGVNVCAQKASKLQPKQMNVFGLCCNICPNGHSEH